MQEAAGQGLPQAMLSVAGIPQEKLEELCKEAKKSETGGEARIANVLFPQGFSCSGTKKAIETLKTLAENNDALQAYEEHY